jgi:hypothetical protein
MDSKGNVYTDEVEDGKRIQRFVPTNRGKKWTGEALQVAVRDGFDKLLKVRVHCPGVPVSAVSVKCCAFLLQSICCTSCQLMERGAHRLEQQSANASLGTS